MKLQIETMLLSAQSPEDNELQITWDITASANVREYADDTTTPGELLIDDIEIIAIRCWSIRYGSFGTGWPLETDLKASWARLEWLNAILDERDDWTSAIRIAATREHERQQAQSRN